MQNPIIKTFRGVRYNSVLYPDLSAVVSQPHDRVRHGLQQKYHDLSAHNVVRLIQGIAEKDHQPVADEFVDGALVLENDFRHFFKIFVQRLPDLLGPLGCAPRCKARDIAEKDCEAFFFTDL